MALRAIAEELAQLPRLSAGERELRACLANLLRGIEQKHIEPPRAEKRLVEMANAYNRATVRDFRTLLREHDKAMSLFGAQDHFYRPGPLDLHLDRKAVSIQANEDGLLGVFWLSPSVRAGAAEIADAFRDGKCTGFVGADDRAIWLTPLSDEVADLLGRAQSSFCTISDRAEIARRLVAVLGLSHIKRSAEILAMVTRETLGDLLFERPDDLARQGPSGSTAIEARGHRRFRAWPTTPPGRYGRTYDMDATERAAAGAGEFGALEAVSSRLPLSAFDSCIFIGELSDSAQDDGSAYLDHLGVAGQSATDLLLQLADMFGL